MAQQVQKNRKKAVIAPDFRKIYTEIIERYHPHTRKCCEEYLRKETWTSMDVMTVNHLIYGNPKKEDLLFNQNHRSYDRATIMEILEYQKKNGLNNVQLANTFKLSRNTVAKWKIHYENRSGN